MVEQPVVHPWGNKTCLGLPWSCWLLCRHSMHWRQRLLVMRSTSMRRSMLNLIRLLAWEHTCVYSGELGITNTRKAMSGRYRLLDHAEHLSLTWPTRGDPASSVVRATERIQGLAVWGFWLLTDRGAHKKYCAPTSRLWVSHNIEELH